VQPVIYNNVFPAHWVIKVRKKLVSISVAKAAEEEGGGKYNDTMIFAEVY
jgi:hypothetical protein